MVPGWTAAERELPLPEEGSLDAGPEAWVVRRSCLWRAPLTHFIIQSLDQGQILSPGL